MGQDDTGVADVTVGHLATFCPAQKRRGRQEKTK
jgi:hypothetical protein